MPYKPKGSLKKVFLRADTPGPDELRGYYAVRLVIGLLPPIRFFRHMKFFPVDVESPESGSGGFNEFLGRVRIGRFMVARSQSALRDGQTVLQIIYDRTGNPFWLRPLTDEIKKIDDDVYLGRGVIRLFGLAFNSFYFTVEKSSFSVAGHGGFRAGLKKRFFGLADRSGARKTRKPVIRGRQEGRLLVVMAAIIPRDGEFAPGAADFDLVPRINQLLDRFDPVARMLLPWTLSWLNLQSLLYTGSSLTALSQERMIRFLSGLEQSRLIYNRYLIVMLKLFTMLAFYEQPAAAEAIGYDHGCHPGQDGEDR